MGVVLVDHLTLGGTKEWCSMRREGYFPRTDGAPHTVAQAVRKIASIVIATYGILPL